MSEWMRHWREMEMAEVKRRSWTRLGFGGLVDRADGGLRKTGRTEEGIFKISIAGAMYFDFVAIYF